MKDHSIHEADDFNDNGENFECAQYFADAVRGSHRKAPPMPLEPIQFDPDPVGTGLRIANAILAAVYGPKGGAR